MIVVNGNGTSLSAEPIDLFWVVGSTYSKASTLRKDQVLQPTGAKQDYYLIIKVHDDTSDTSDLLTFDVMKCNVRH